MFRGPALPYELKPRPAPCRCTPCGLARALLTGVGWFALGFLLAAWVL
jgi:hypothetical protein